jgi:hypothetical protein
MPRPTPKLFPKSEAPENISRASHMCECEVCGKMYIDHQLLCYYDFGEENLSISQMRCPLFLHQICNGKIYKL